MHEARLRMLRRQALQEAFTPSGVLSRVRAIDQMVREDGRFPVELFQSILIAACENPSGSWEGSRAASMAGKTLDYIAKCQRDWDLEWPSETPDAPAPPGYWPFGPECPEDERDFEPLLRVSPLDTEGSRDRWREALMGRPPWRRGELATVDGPVEE